MKSILGLLRAKDTRPLTLLLTQVNTGVALDIYNVLVDNNLDEIKRKIEDLTKGKLNEIHKVQTGNSSV